MTRILLALLTSITLGLGSCEAEDVPHTPTLAEVSAEADAAVDLVDRDAELDGAVEGQAGENPDLDDPHSGFRMDVDANGIEAVYMADGPWNTSTLETYANVVTALIALDAADAVTLAVLGPPAAAIAIVLAGDVQQINDHLWSATNHITGPTGHTIAGEFNVAWVGVGWLAEMRLSSNDGVYDDTLWFNGFISVAGAVGWWDIYLDGTDVAGVVEWVDHGDGHSEFGIAALMGDAAGDVLVYQLWESHGYVGYYDASEAFESHVQTETDFSGEVLLLGYNNEQPGCWDWSFADCVCP